MRAGRREEVEAPRRGRGVEDDEVDVGVGRVLVQRLDAHVLEDAGQRVHEAGVEAVPVDAREGVAGSRRARGGARTWPSGRSGGRGGCRPAGGRERARRPACSRARRGADRPSACARRRAGSTVRTSATRPRRAAARPTAAESVVFPTPPGPVRTISFSPSSQGRRSRCGWFGGKKEGRGEERDLLRGSRAEARPERFGRAASRGLGRLKIFFEGGEKGREKRRCGRGDLAASLPGPPPHGTTRRNLLFLSFFLSLCLLALFGRFVVDLRNLDSGIPVSLFSRISSLPPRPTRFTTTSAVATPAAPLGARDELLGLRRRELGRLGDGDERGCAPDRRGARRRRARACAAVRRGRSSGSCAGARGGRARGPSPARRGRSRS